jgi:hypothetical protein
MGEGSTFFGGTARGRGTSAGWLSRWLDVADGNLDEGPLQNNEHAVVVCIFDG